MSEGRALGIPEGVADVPLDAPRRVPIEVIGGHIYVRATIDGRSGLFVLDTGAPVLFLNTARLRLPPAVDSARMGDATGTGIFVRQQRVSSFAWGGMTYRNVGALTLDMRQLEEHVLNVPAKDTVLGIIGLGQFTPFTVVFDYAEHELVLYPSTPSSQDWGPLPPPVATVPVVFTNSAIGVPVRAGNTLSYLKLDSGSEECIVDASLAPELGSHLLATGAVSSIMGGGNRVVAVPYAKLDRMSVGPVNYDGLVVQLYPWARNVSDSVPMRGLLGAPFFKQQRVGLSVQRREMYFWSASAPRTESPARPAPSEGGTAWEIHPGTV